MNSINTYPITFLLLIILTSCAVVKNIDKIENGDYNLTKRDKFLLEKFPKKTYKKNIFIEDLEDSVRITFTLKSDQSEKDTLLKIERLSHLYLDRAAIDVNIFTIPFKLRPSVNDFPTQFNVDFNGALYLGKRHEYYKLGLKLINKKHAGRYTVANGFGYGFFLGASSITMNSFVTQNSINYEYSGFALQTGLAGIYDIKIFNIGIGVGIDHLMDRNRKLWICQNKPWVGILFSLNLK